LALPAAGRRPPRRSAAANGPVHPRLRLAEAAATLAAGFLRYGGRKQTIEQDRLVFVSCSASAWSEAPAPCLGTFPPETSPTTQLSAPLRPSGGNNRLDFLSE